MQSTKVRMVLVAVLVCLFAIGMAGLLNYYKYRGTADRIVKERLLVVGNSIDSSIQSSLALGLQFSDLGSLTGTMERERATDQLIVGIDVFDTEGKALYSTDRQRVGSSVPASWTQAAQNAKSTDWFVEADAESAAGMAIRNSFGLTIGHLAVRFSEDRVQAANAAVVRELMISALAIFVVAAGLASVALVAVKNRLMHDIALVEATLKSADPARLPEAVRRGPLGGALRRFFETVRNADGQLAQLRSHLQRGAQP
jgi:sensor histidine kinase regulating citrate/malate metabolism